MSAIRYLRSVAPVLRKSENEISHKFENIIFRLHNNFTAAALIGASILLGATEFFGKPIDCITSAQKNVINTYCWVTSTFTMDDYHGREIGHNIVHPGIAGNSYTSEEEMMKKWTFHNYYQWVIHMLVIQAALFYGPKFVWKLCEGGLMKCLSDSMHKCQILLPNKVNQNKKRLSGYLLTHIKLHNGYVLKYISCEFMCFFNVLCQLFLIDRFLGGEFMTYGTKVFEFAESDQSSRVDPMIYVFPTMTKCTFHLFGPSGTTQIRDALCLLPQNILNQKVFIFMWFWFMALGFLLCGLMVYRLMMIFLPAIRPRLIHFYTKSVPYETLKVITKKTSLGDWWLLYNLVSVVDPDVYRETLMTVAKEIETEASNKPSYSASNGGASAPDMYHQSSV